MLIGNLLFDVLMFDLSSYFKRMRDISMSIRNSRSQVFYKITVLNSF